VIASDGVWEFLTNKQVMDMIVPYYNRNDIEGACEKVIDEAVKSWRRVFFRIILGG
jgi:serine/threonine protein phosphatase PrpC